jgi:hypothetical protein
VSAAVPVGASGRVESQGSAVEPISRHLQNKGADFSTRLSRIDSQARVGRRELERLRGEATDRDGSIVRFLAEFRLASAAQLRRRFFPEQQFATADTAARTSRRVLGRLASHRLLVRLERRVGGLRAGSDGFVYGIGPVGHRLIEPEGRSRPRFVEPSPAFVHHHLAVTELAVELEVGGRGGAFELLDVAGEPRCWRTLPGQRARAGALRPDLHIRLRTGEVELSWFVEVDMGTAHLPAVLRKCSLYETYYRSGVEQAEHGIFPRVIWVTQTERRRARLWSAIDRRHGLTNELFVVADSSEVLGVLRGREFSP